MSDEKPTNVIAALARVMEELPAIGKAERSNQGYNYRGIEQITAHAQRLFGRFGVVFTPKIIDRKTIALTVNGKPWTEEQLLVSYTVYGPAGVEDCIEVGPVLGLGRDNSDKGGNKALTQAFKYALLQTLCVSDAKDDADRDVAHEADPTPPPVDLKRYIGDTLDPADQELLKKAWKYPFKAQAVPAAQSQDVTTFIDSFVGKAAQQAQGEAYKPGEEPAEDV